MLEVKQPLVSVLMTLSRTAYIQVVEIEEHSIQSFFSTIHSSRTELDAMSQYRPLFDFFDYLDVADDEL